MLFSVTIDTSKPQRTDQMANTPGEVYRSRVWEDLRNLFQHDHLTDVMLAAEGRSIPCHKVLLAAASKFFYDKFITNPESLEHNILDIDDIDFDTLTSVVSFIYSGNIELTVEKTEKLIPASISLMLRELTEECSNFLGKMKDDTSDFVAVYKIAKANSLENIAQKAWRLMLEKIQDITTTDAFKKLSETDLEEYIRDENLNVASEDPVFEAVVTWVKHDMANRKSRFEDLLENITLSHCSLDFLRDVVMQEPLMKSSANGFERVAAALASQAKSQSMQLGTPRKVLDSNTFLVLIDKDKCRVLRNGESEWVNENLMTGKILPCSSASRTGDGILITGGGSYPTYSKQCCKLSLPTLDYATVSDLNVGRRSHASVCVGGDVYVLGGYTDSGELQSVEYLDGKSGFWCLTTDMPVALYYHTAVNYKHYIYVFGGMNESYNDSCASFVLDTISKTWSKKADMPQYCTCGSSVVYRDTIYVLGDNCCMSYNPAQNRWQTHSAPVANHDGGSCVVWGDRIFLCGGYSTTLIEEYNPTTDVWTEWKHSVPQQGWCTVLSVQLQ